MATRDPDEPTGPEALVGFLLHELDGPTEPRARAAPEVGTIGAADTLDALARLAGVDRPTFHHVVDRHERMRRLAASASVRAVPTTLALRADVAASERATCSATSSVPFRLVGVHAPLADICTVHEDCVEQSNLGKPQLARACWEETLRRKGIPTFPSVWVESFCVGLDELLPGGPLPAYVLRYHATPGRLVMPGELVQITIRNPRPVVFHFEAVVRGIDLSDPFSRAAFSRAAL